MRSFILLLALCGTIFFTACQTEQSADVNQDRIYTQYELYYNAEEDITYARAWFRFGKATGTQLELSSPSQVTFEGETLAFIDLLGFYEKKIAGYKEKGIFKWEDTDGKVFENTIQITPIQMGAIPDSVVRTAAFDIPWTGNPLATDEAVVVWVNGSGEGDAQAALTVEEGTGSIILPLDKVSKIAAGPGKIYLQRRTRLEIDQKTGAGGELTAVYQPKTKAVVFK
jgi:hypothetical protein